jgi:hypothetical protein
MGKRVLGIMGFVAAIALAAACKEDEPRPPVAADDLPPQPGIGKGGGGGAADGGVQPEGGRDAGDSGDAGTCTDLPNTGAAIDQTAVSGDPPAGTGGTISDGIYDLTDARVYQGISGVPGLTGASYQGTIRLTGQSYERVLVFKSSGGAIAESRVSGSFIPSGVNGTIALTCPIAAQEQITYSVVTNSLTVSNLVTKESFTFTKKL